MKPPQHTPTPWHVGGFHKDTEGNPNWVGIGNGTVAIAHAREKAHPKWYRKV